MKKIILVALFPTIFIQCNKDNSTKTPVKDVTGITWTLFSLQKITDPFITPFPYPWYLQLNDDRRFIFTLHNVTGTGTYSWVQLDSINAKVSFNIQKWNFPVVDTPYTNRLKEILLTIDSCHYLKSPNLLPIPLTLSTAKMELQFVGNEGYFYVFIF